MFPQPVTFRTKVAVTVFLHITDVADVVFIQIQIHGIFKAVGGMSYQPSCDVTGFCFLQVIHMTEGYTPPPPPPLTEGYTPPPPPLIEGYTPQQQQYSQSIVTLLYFENQ
jgi:hypothetical protein